jgi:hypothetical protein
MRWSHLSVNTTTRIPNNKPVIEIFLYHLAFFNAVDRVRIMALDLGGRW